MERQDAKGREVAIGTERRREPGLELDLLAGRVIGACIEVHRCLGPGFLESVYEEAVCIELDRRGIAFERQRILQVLYRGQPVGQSRLDLLVEEELVVELKAVEALRPVHSAQMLSYLRAGEFQLGLLVNFNTTLLRDGLRRVVWTG